MFRKRKIRVVLSAAWEDRLIVGLIKTTLENCRRAGYKIEVVYCNYVKRAGEDAPHKVKEEFGSKKTDIVVPVVTPRFTAACHQEIGFAEALGKPRVGLVERNVPLDSEHLGIFMTSGEEYILFRRNTLKKAAKELAKRIVELKNKDTWVSKARMNWKRMLLEALAFGAGFLVTMLVLPIIPASDQISMGAALDLAVAFVLRHL
jgi:hypothetical protein